MSTKAMDKHSSTRNFKNACPCSMRVRQVDSLFRDKPPKLGADARSPSSRVCLGIERRCFNIFAAQGREILQSGLQSVCGECIRDFVDTDPGSAHDGDATSYLRVFDDVTKRIVQSVQPCHRLTHRLSKEDHDAAALKPQGPRMLGLVVTAEPVLPDRLPENSHGFKPHAFALLGAVGCTKADQMTCSGILPSYLYRRPWTLTPPSTVRIAPVT